ncbi:uncharacterized protein LOC6566481 [Drosophila grimshawi]|uniref:GH13798 n=1 Tax=Drosophila grimshawi TaxID=7222 RepID=B4JR12_DROGR|nr:uncharacterized protein LOC6566481 [Drosophila grimshawi]EDV99342.1 GH13798 [Drosophila grimshawi]
MALDNYFDKVRGYHPGILTNVARVLLNAKCTSPERTMTLSQIRVGYRLLTEDKFPSMADPRVEMLFLLLIPFVACFTNKHGTYHFYITRLKES